jgi:hypothetical protein
MTGEHIWSNWLEKVFGEHKYNFSRIEHDSNNKPLITAEWRAVSVNLKAHVVCDTCNNRWMSDLETETKAVTSEMIVNGKSRSLSVKDIVIISAFAFKTAVVVDHMNMYSKGGRRPLTGSFFRRSDRENFRKFLVFPDNVHIWLAEFREGDAASGRLRPYYFHNKTGPWKNFHFFVVSYVVGHLVFQIVCPRPAGISWHARNFPPLVQSSEWNPRSTLIWPNRGFEVDWPPPHYLIDKAINAFAYRW